MCCVFVTFVFMDKLIIVSNEKAKGGFVLVDKRTNESLIEGSFTELTESKDRMNNLGYGLEFMVMSKNGEKNRTLRLNK